jgi:hypothetical protein
LGAFDRAGDSPPPADQRSVERARQLSDVKALTAEKESAGLTLEDTLEALLYSPNEATRLRAAVELGRLRAADGYRASHEADARPHVTVYEAAS